MSSGRKTPRVVEETPRRATRIHAYRNGAKIAPNYLDLPNDGKATINAVPKSFQLLLNMLTYKLDLDFAVKRVFTADGAEIDSLADIEHNMAVVVSKGEGFKRPNRKLKAPPTRMKVDTAPKRVFVYLPTDHFPEDMRDPRRCVIVPRTFDVFLEKASALLGMSFGARRAFVQQGTEVSSVADLENGDIVFVTAGTNFKQPQQAQPSSRPAPTLVDDEDIKDAVRLRVRLRGVDFFCNNCKTRLRPGNHYSCATCPIMDLCTNCFLAGAHTKHPMVDII